MKHAAGVAGQMVCAAVSVGAVAWLVARNDLGWPWWVWPLVIAAGTAVAWLLLVGLVCLVNHPSPDDVRGDEWEEWS